MENKNRSTNLIVGTVIVIFVVSAFLAVVVKKTIWLQLSNTYGAFTIMSVSFLKMVISIGTMLSWIIVLLCVCYAAFKFTRKFVQLIKDGERIIKLCENISKRHHQEFEDRFHNFVNRVDRKLFTANKESRELAYSLREALKPIEEIRNLNKKSSHDSEESFDDDDFNSNSFNPY